jgi:hypothetical protein
MNSHTKWAFLMRKGVNEKMCKKYKYIDSTYNFTNNCIIINIL